MQRRNRSYILIALLFTLLVSSCSNQSTAQPIGTKENGPVFATSIPSPTPSPTAGNITAKDIGVSLPGEGISGNLQEITKDNVDRLQQIAVYGPGTYYYDYFWSPSKKLFAVSREAGFEVFDLATHQSIGAIASFGQTTLLGFTSEDKILLRIAKPQGTYLALYSISAGKYVSIIGYRDNSIEPANQVRINTDHTIAADDESGKVGIWDLITGEKKNTFEIGSENWLYWISSDGTKFATLDKNFRIVTLWSSLFGEKIASITMDSNYPFDNSENQQNSIDILQEAEIILARNGQQVKVWNLPSGNQLSNFDIGKDYQFFDISKNGKILATAKNDESFNFWNIDDGNLLSTVEINNVRHDCANRYMFTADSTRFVTFDYRDAGKYCGYGNNSLTVWNVSDGTKITTFAIHADYSFFQSPNEKYLVPFVGSSANPGALQFGNLENGDYVIVDYADREYTRVAVSPDDSHAVFFSNNKTSNGQLVTGYRLNIADLENNKLLDLAIPNDWTRVNQIMFSPDGSMTAVDIFDQWKNDDTKLCTGVVFWDLNGNQIGNICFSDGLFDEIQFSKDSQHLMLFNANTCQRSGDRKSISLETGKVSYTMDGIDWLWPMSTDTCIPLQINGLPAGGKTLELGPNWILKDEQGNVLFDNLGPADGVVPASSKSGDVIFFGQRDPITWETILSYYKTSDSSIREINPRITFDKYIWVYGRDSIASNYVNNSMSKIMMSPDGKILATINRGTVILWGVRSPSE